MGERLLDSDLRCHIVSTDIRLDRPLDKETEDIIYRLHAEDVSIRSAILSFCPPEARDPT